MRSYGYLEGTRFPNGRTQRDFGAVNMDFCARSPGAFENACKRAQPRKPAVSRGRTSTAGFLGWKTAETSHLKQGLDPSPVSTISISQLSLVYSASAKPLCADIANPASNTGVEERRGDSHLALSHFQGGDGRPHRCRPSPLPSQTNRAGSSSGNVRYEMHYPKRTT
ncbi:hypothetical protein BD310DRAFT_216862 [Dichomitus squalens]|uniref:Uncharacterized protein n=1 Tax=Dichomitus squalens TaxID=114155 RepID=A0A4Q9Q231_9APHY|nr:hypothetical protein BD310DRAFT_216862 [Dichomitus squalens]